MSVQDIIYTFTTSFIALFPVMNPISSGFIINSFLEGADGQDRSRYVRRIVLNTLFLGLGSLAAGHLVLLIFGLAVPVIQVGGGLVICKTGWDWLSDSGDKKAENSKEKAISKLGTVNMEQRLFYPVSFPITMGPGTISVIFTLMANTAEKEDILTTAVNYGIIGAVIMLLCFILYIFLSQASRISRSLGASGNLIINKFISFIMFCIGIQILVTGISKIFHLQIL